MQGQGILKLQDMKVECTMSSACRCESESEKLDKENIVDHKKSVDGSSNFEIHCFRAQQLCISNT